MYHQLNFAREHDSDDKTKQIFQDESHFHIRSTVKRVYVKRGKATPPCNIKHLRACVNVFGIMMKDKLYVKTFKVYLNKDSFSDLLSGFFDDIPLHAVRGYKLVLDRASFHRNESVRSTYSLFDVEILEWPTKSPEYNAIELV